MVGSVLGIKLGWADGSALGALLGCAEGKIDGPIERALGGSSLGVEEDSGKSPADGRTVAAPEGTKDGKC